MIVAAAALVMACGGNSGGRSKNLSIEDKVADHNNKLLGIGEEILKLKDKATEMDEEFGKWYESLSDEDKDKADAAEKKWIEENRAKIDKINNAF